MVDELRKAEFGRLNPKSEGKDWYQQTPEERQYHRTLRSPWWARVTKNTLDLATYTLPSLLAERLAEQGSDYSVLFPNNVLAAAGASNENRQALQRAINHYHAAILIMENEVFETLIQRGFNNCLQICKSLKASGFVP